MSITAIIGSMFCGKTSELIRLIDRKRIAGKKCLIIKHAKDNRFDGPEFNGIAGTQHVTTHSDIRYCKCDIIYRSDFTDDEFTKSICEKYEAVGIDEGFFFKGLANFCNTLANNGIDVIVATLDSSYKQELFPEVGDLLAKTENIIKLKAVCMRCKQAEASFTIRTVESNEEILVGGAEMYECVCRPCLKSHREQQDQ